MKFQALFPQKKNKLFSSIDPNAAFADSADPETACKEDPLCLPFCYWFLTETHICNKEFVQIQR